MAFLLSRLGRHSCGRLYTKSNYFTPFAQKSHQEAIVGIAHTFDYSLNQTSIFGSCLALGTCTYAFSEAQKQDGLSEPKKKHLIEPESHELINWSGTHAVSTQRYFTPENEAELIEIVNDAHENKKKLRPIGSALSPNGLGFESEGMVSLVNMNKILEIDLETNRVTVQAGASVNEVVQEIRKHGLTLQNFASITEQQIGGFIQVGAHGTGARIPPVDEQVVSLKLVTPAAGVLRLSAEDYDPSLFYVVRTALGMLGIVSQVTLQCVPMHQLVEKTFVASSRDVLESHEKLMKQNRHLRYMWIPYTDAVVVVTCNPVTENLEPIKSKYTDSERNLEARKLLLSHPKCNLSEEQIGELKFTSLRSELLALDPVNVDWIRKVNKAEASFWRKSEGVRIGYSDEILQFDCGGQQWVSEIAFPVPKDLPEQADVKYIYDLLDLIESEKIPAPAPIEQRWTASSLSPMSPAAEKPDKKLASVYSWVGIIMYLPDSEVDAVAREKVTKAFKRYKGICEKRLWSDVGAVEHWAKIEKPETPEEEARLRLRMHKKYPIEAFDAMSRILDPHGVLRNELMDVLLGGQTDLKA